MHTPPRRRWFQFSLAEWLILTTLLGVAWWQCTRWPVADIETRIVEVTFDGTPLADALKKKDSELADYLKKPDSERQQEQFVIWPTYFTTQKMDVAIERLPTRREVAGRWAISSAVIIGVWLICSIAARRIAERRRPAAQS